MGKELVISRDRHETRLAILEEGQLVEVYFQRANEYSLAGSIHKGRVTRVLPGMQSAFVDLGLERDTFLYVSDFFEESGEDFDKVGDDRRNRPPRRESLPPTPPPAPVAAPVIEAVAMPAAEPVEEAEEGEAAEGSEESAAADPNSAPRDPRFDGRNRNRRRRRRGGSGRFPDSKFAEAGGPVRDQPRFTPPEAEAAPSERAEFEPEPAESEPLILPGESLSKYRRPASTGREESEGRAVEARPAELARQAEPEAEREIEPATPTLVTAVPEPDAPIHHPVMHPGELPVEAEVEMEDSEPIEVIDAIDAIDALDEPKETVAPQALAAVDETDEGVKAALAHLADIELEARGGDGEAREASGAEFEEPGDEAEPSDESDEELSAEAPSGAAASAEPGEGATLSAEQREQPRRFLQQRSGDRRRRRGRGGDRGDRGDRGERGERGDRPPQAERPAEARPAEGGREQREQREPRERHERSVQPLITDLLKEGQEILVQIAKEPLGQKGARITSHIALPGRYCVYMPTVEHTGVSRKISSDEERQRLKKILIQHKAGLPGGFIIRTAGEGRTEQEIAADIHYLYDTWLDIRTKAEKRRAPAVVYHDLDIVERTLRDQLSDEFKSIWCDSEEIYENILSFVQRMMPAMVGRVKMYTRDVPIFDAFQVTTELEKALRPKVWLKSGGYLVINQTEALVAIDINTGKFIGKSNRLEDTIVRTNIDAVKEIVRQIRLRDLGGIIVIDFIDMDERKNRQKVMQALEEAMRADRAPYKILQFNDFGLVAITRKRVKQSLERTLCQPCPACEGAGYVRSVQTVISDILIEARKIAAAVDGKECLLRVNPEVAKELKSTSNTFVEELEEILRRPVAVLADPLIHHEKFDLS